MNPASAEGRVWVLNPDAERELGGAVQSTARHIAQMRARAAMFDFLTCGEPRVLLADLATRRFSGERTLIWCPTPSALAAARKSGLAVGRAPSLDALRRVNDKRFPTKACPHLTLPARSIVTFSEAIASLPLPLRLKRPFGFAGKGQRTLLARGRPDDQRWLEESLRKASLVAEPELPGLIQVSCHGVAVPRECVDARAEPRALATLVGRPVALVTDSYGAPTSVERATLGAELERAVVTTTMEVAHYLEAEGYFGPFGVDYALVDGRPYLLDLNARFTLGFSVGFAEERGAALSLIERLSSLA